MLVLPITLQSSLPGKLRELEGDDRRLFDLVTRQFLAAFYPQAVIEEIERITTLLANTSAVDHRRY